MGHHGCTKDAAGLVKAVEMLGAVGFLGEWYRCDGGLPSRLPQCGRRKISFEDFADASSMNGSELNTEADDYSHDE